MNPSLSSVNQNLLMKSNCFLVPASPDYFSVVAIDSLTTVIPRWRAWAKQAAGVKVLQGATYPFPNVTPQFLGTIVQKYRIRNTNAAATGSGAPTSAKPAEGFQRWIDEVNKIVANKFIPMLRTEKMLIASERYEPLGLGANRCLAESFGRADRVNGSSAGADEKITRDVQADFYTPVRNRC
jgi:hypothetical protein